MIVILEQPPVRGPEQSERIAGINSRIVEDTLRLHPAPFQMLCDGLRTEQMEVPGHVFSARISHARRCNVWDQENKAPAFFEKLRYFLKEGRRLPHVFQDGPSGDYVELLSAKIHLEEVPHPYWNGASTFPFQEINPLNIPPLARSIVYEIASAATNIEQCAARMAGKEAHHAGVNRGHVFLCFIFQIVLWIEFGYAAFCRHGIDKRHSARAFHDVEFSAGNPIDFREKQSMFL